MTQENALCLAALICVWTVYFLCIVVGWRVANEETALRESKEDET